MQACKQAMAPIVESVDEGWGIPAEPAGSLICSVPNGPERPVETPDFQACDFHAGVVGADELDGGWNLAEGTVEHEVSEFARAHGLMPLSFRPAPLASEQVLSAEEQAEFSKPDLALGTDIDLPPPPGLWFAELAPVVARHVPRPARGATAPAQQEVEIKSCFSASEDSFFAEGDELANASETAAAEADCEDEQETISGKRRWWHWGR